MGYICFSLDLFISYFLEKPFWIEVLIPENYSLCISWKIIDILKILIYMDPPLAFIFNFLRIKQRIGLYLWIWSNPKKLYLVLNPRFIISPIKLFMETLIKKGEKKEKARKCLLLNEQININYLYRLVIFELLIWFYLILFSPDTDIGICKYN